MTKQEQSALKMVKFIQAQMLLLFEKLNDSILMTAQTKVKTCMNSRSNCITD